MFFYTYCIHIEYNSMQYDANSIFYSFRKKQTFSQKLQGKHIKALGLAVFPCTTSHGEKRITKDAGKSN